MFTVTESELETDVAFRWVRRKFNVLFIQNCGKERRKISCSLSLSVNAPFYSSQIWSKIRKRNNGQWLFFTLKYSAEIYCGRLRNLRIFLVIYSMFMLLLTTTLLKVLNLNNKYKSQQGLVLEILIFSSKKKCIDIVIVCDFDAIKL